MHGLVLYASICCRQDQPDWNRHELPCSRIFMAVITIFTALDCHPLLLHSIIGFGYRNLRYPSPVPFPLLWSYCVATGFAHIHLSTDVVIPGTTAGGLKLVWLYHTAGTVTASTTTASASDAPASDRQVGRPASSGTPPLSKAGKRAGGSA